MYGFCFCFCFCFLIFIFFSIYRKLNLKTFTPGLLGKLQTYNVVPEICHNLFDTFYEVATRKIIPIWNFGKNSNSMGSEWRQKQRRTEKLGETLPILASLIIATTSQSTN